MKIRLKNLKRKLNSDAMSQSMSLTLVMLIFFVSAGTSLIVGPAYIESEENRHENQSTASQYDSIVEALDTLIINGNGSVYNGELVISDGSIEIDSKGEKLIIAYSADSDWDFNVEGLEDDDSEFTVTMTDPTKSIDNATFYWLSDNCFLPFTKISMVDGSLKNIQDIKRGDKIRSFDIESGSFVFSTVKSLLSYKQDLMDDYYLIINDKLRVTPNHKILINNEFIDVEYLKIGDIACNSLGQNIMIHSIEKVYSKSRTYDLILDSGSFYFADGFLVKSDVKQVIITDSNGIGRMYSANAELDSVAEEQGNQGQGEPTGPQTAGSGCILNAAQDGYVQENFPDSTNNFNNEYLQVDSWAGINNVARALIKFPLENIPNDALVEKAKLKLYYHHYYDEGSYEDPEGNTFFTQEIDDYQKNTGDTIVWENADTSWNHWDKTANKYWELRGSWPTQWRCHMRTTDEHPEIGDSTIAEITMPSEGNWVTWEDSSPIDDGIGMTASVQAMVKGVANGGRSNTGWMISGHESENKRNAVFFYSSDASDYGVSLDYEPKLYVWYVEPPQISNEILYASDIGTTSVTLHGQMDEHGLGNATLDTYNAGTHCYFGYSMWGGGTHYTTPGNDQRVKPFSEVVTDGIYPGVLYQFWSKAYNDAGEDRYEEWLNSDFLFLTIPEKPDNLVQTYKTSDRIDLGWENPTFVDQPFLETSTIIVGRTDHYPINPFEWEYDGNAILFYNGTEEECSKDDLDPSTTYYLRAWTWIRVMGYGWDHGEPECVFLSQVSDQYENLVATTSPSGPLPPVACFTWNDDDLGGSGTLLNFDASCSYPRGGATISSYAWDWDNDGTYDNGGVTQTHDYGDDEEHIVKLKVTQDNGYWDIEQKVVQATVPGPPTACFTWQDADGEDSETIINFNAGCSSDDGTIVSYLWDWENDGTFDDAGIAVSHDYGDTLTHQVKLEVTDDDTMTDSVIQEVEASVGNAAPTKPIEIEILYNPNRLQNGTYYTFSARVNDPDLDTISVRFDWDGDLVPDTNWYGPYDVDGNGKISDYYPEDQLPSHHWTSSGVYDVRVQAKDDEEEESEWSDPIALRIFYKYIVPPDTESTQTIEDADDGQPDSETFTADQPITDAVCIQLFSDNYPENAPAEDKGKVPFGIIYVYYQGALKVKSKDSGNSQSILQNGGILSVLPNGVNVNSLSNIYEKDDTLGFSVSIIRGDSAVSGSGAGTYGINFKNIDTFTREQQNYNVYNFKVKYCGQYGSYWHDYLSRNTKFAAQSGQFSDFLVYDEGNAKQLVFSTALIQTKLI